MFCYLCVDFIIVLLCFFDIQVFMLYRLDIGGMLVVLVILFCTYISVVVICFFVFFFSPTRSNFYFFSPLLMFGISCNYLCFLLSF